MTAASARSEALLVSAAVLAGALAGVIVQAAIEVGRGRREDREQLRAAGALLDAADAAADEQARQLATAWAALDQQRQLVDELRDELRDGDDERTEQRLRDVLVPCLCGARWAGGAGPQPTTGEHEPTCPRWEPDDQAGDVEAGPAGDGGA